MSRRVSVAVCALCCGTVVLAGWHFLAHRGGLLQLSLLTEEFVDTEAVATTWSPWTRVGHCHRRRMDFALEFIKHMAVGASHVRLCAAGNTTDCVVAPVRHQALRLLARHTDPCGFDCDRSDWGRLCTWVRGRNKRGIEVYLNTHTKSLGLASERTDCNATGPWLGTMSVAKCATQCARWGRFVHATDGDGSCKCAGEDCQPVVDESTGVALYEPKPATSTLAKMDGIMRLVPRHPVPVRFKRCALLGSSKDLIGRGLGAEIDAHDTVIRVNRIPKPKHFQDFGSRNDVLFIGAKQQHKMMYAHEGQWYWTFGGRRKLCRKNAAKCPFDMVVLKFGKRKNRAKHRKASYLTAQVSGKVHAFGRVMLKNYMRRKAVPTTGFEAFVAFGLLCNEMTMYGFSGNKTADGHRFFGVHSVKGVQKEHELIEMLLAGEFNYTRRLNPDFLKRIQERQGKHRIVHF